MIRLSLALACFTLFAGAAGAGEQPVPETCAPDDHGCVICRTMQANPFMKWGSLGLCGAVVAGFAAKRLFGKPAADQIL